jgi:hypothetical protein
VLRAAPSRPAASFSLFRPTRRSDRSSTATVWFGDPQDECLGEETGDEVILMNDRAGRLIEFEKLNSTAATPEQLRISFETVGL